MVAATLSVLRDDGLVVDEGWHGGMVVGGVRVGTLTTWLGAGGRAILMVGWWGIHVGFVFCVVFLQNCVNDGFDATICPLEGADLSTGEGGGRDVGSTKESDVSFRGTYTLLDVCQ